MWELILAGGWLMLPLLLCSIFTLAISLERWLRLRRHLVLPVQLQLEVGQHINAIDQDWQQSVSLQETALGRILQAGYQCRTQADDYTRAQMEVVASQEISALEKNINFLGTISATAPLLGLLGTVLGIIESFLLIDLANSGPASMIPGISQALITTAAGMLIAIPALFAYRYFQRLVQEYITELEQQSTLFHAALYASCGTDDLSMR